MSVPAFSDDNSVTDWESIGTTSTPNSTAPKPASTVRERVGRIAGSNKTGPKAASKPARAPRASKPKEPPSKRGEFTEEITGFYAMIGLAVGTRDPQCGQVIMENAESIAVEWDKLAESNDAVRKALRALTKTTAIGTLVAAHVPIIMAVSAHHGVGFGPKVAHDNDADSNDPRAQAV